MSERTFKYTDSFRTIEVRMLSPWLEGKNVCVTISTVDERKGYGCIEFKLNGKLVSYSFSDEISGIWFVMKPPKLPPKFKELLQECIDETLSSERFTQLFQKASGDSK